MAAKKVWKVTVVQGKAIDLEIALNKLTQDGWEHFQTHPGYGWTVISFMVAPNPGLGNTPPEPAPSK